MSQETFNELVSEAQSRPGRSQSKFNDLRDWLAVAVIADFESVNATYITRGSANFRNRIGQRGIQSATSLAVLLLDDQRFVPSAIEFVRGRLRDGELSGAVAIAPQDNGQWRVLKILEPEGVKFGERLMTSLADDQISLEHVAVRRTGEQTEEAQAGMRDWWVGDETQPYWFEITGRSDIGDDLKAPTTAGSEDRPVPHWSHSLVRQVPEGDVVFHWSTTSQAIVGASVATGDLTRSAQPQRSGKVPVDSSPATILTPHSAAIPRRHPNERTGNP